MSTPFDLPAVLRTWTTILGPEPGIGGPLAGRELWPVDAADGSRYFLKRLGQWRNLPVGDEARILRHLAGQGIPVAEFLPTDDGRTTAGAVEDAFVLMPRIDAVELDPGTVVATESSAGRAIARLHRALAAYPDPAHSYTEEIAVTLLEPLALPPDIRDAVETRRQRWADRMSAQSLQLTHGDLTPDNLLRGPAGEVVGIIDLDHLPLAPRIWDVAKYLSRRVRARADDRRIAGLADAVAGYHEETPLVPGERSALPDAIVACNVLEVDYGTKVLTGELPRTMLPDHRAALASTIEATRWQLANEDLVRF